MDSLVEMIKEYWDVRQLKYPNFEEALMWHDTEIGEVCEIRLAQIGGWVRNNPTDHMDYDPNHLQEELGDAILMLIVAGIVEGGDPISALKEKILRKTQTIDPVTDPTVDLLMRVRRLLAECRTAGHGNEYPVNCLEAEELIIDYLKGINK